MKHWEITITKKYDETSYEDSYEAKEQFIEDIANSNFDIDIEEWEDDGQNDDLIMCNQTKN